MEYIEAVEQEDFKSARSYVSDNISYMWPVGLSSFTKAEPYRKYLEHLDLPNLEIKRFSQMMAATISVFPTN